MSLHSHVVSVSQTASVAVAPGVDFTVTGQSQVVFAIPVRRYLRHLLVTEPVDQLRGLYMHVTPNFPDFEATELHATLKKQTLIMDSICS